MLSGKKDKQGATCLSPNGQLGYSNTMMQRVSLINGSSSRQAAV